LAHFFRKTYAEHQKNVRNAQQAAENLYQRDFAVGILGDQDYRVQ
jgi:hypothetical protein